MRVRIICSVSVMLLFLACCLNANAQSYWTYGFYNIVDNTGATLSSTTGAGFNSPICTNVNSGTLEIVSCARSPYGYLTLPLSFYPIGGRGCGNLPPVPFQEYDPTAYPNVANCWVGLLDVSDTGFVNPGIPRCAPGTPYSLSNNCEEPYLFTALPTATTAGGVTLVPSQWTITYTDYSSGAGVATVVPCLEPNGSLNCTSYPLENGLQSGQIPFITLTYAPPVTCAGFQAPFNNPISLPKSSKRAIPLIIQLFDQNNNVVTASSLNAAGPTVAVSYSSSPTSTTYIANSELLPEGQSSTGNQFTFNAATNTWQFNLDTSNFTASGTYTVSVASGDGSQYAVSPTCSQTFTRP